MLFNGCFGGNFLNFIGVQHRQSCISIQNKWLLKSLQEYEEIIIVSKLNFQLVVNVSKEEDNTIGTLLKYNYTAAIFNSWAYFLVAFRFTL